MTESKIKLLPCPFCGSTPRLYGHDVQCPTEGCFAFDGTGVDYDEQEDAIAAWNARSWVDAAAVIEAMQREEPQIYFMDGNSLSGHEAWDKCLRMVLQRLESKGDMT